MSIDRLRWKHLVHQDEDYKLRRCKNHVLDIWSAQYEMIDRAEFLFVGSFEDIRNFCFGQELTTKLGLSWRNQMKMLGCLIGDICRILLRYILMFLLEDVVLLNCIIILLDLSLIHGRF